MQSTKNIASLALVAVSAALLGLPAHASLVTNGGFETGDFTGWTAQGFDPNAPAGQEFAGVDSSKPQAGTFAAFFGTLGTSSISQTLATTAGATYDISFYLMNEADQNGQTRPNAFEFDWDGVSRLALNNVDAFGYTLYEYTLTASTAATDLRFSFSHTPAFWDLDTVNVDPTAVATVPEPGSLALAGLGALGLAVSRRRRGANAAA